MPAMLFRSQYMLELFDAAVVSRSAGATLKSDGGEIHHRWSFLGDVIWADVLCTFPRSRCGHRNGCSSKKISNYGIDDSIIKSVRKKITEDISTIFLLTGDSTPIKWWNH